MNNQYQPIIDDEQEDEYYQGTPSVNHRGKSALYVVAYFALLAILMYPAHRLHLGTQGVFFAMLAAGLLLALCLLAAKWARRKLAVLQLSKKGFIQLMVGYRPDNAAGASPEPEATTGAQPHRTHTSTSLVPLVDQRTVRYGEVVGFDDETEDLPATILEEHPLYLSDSFQPDVNSLLGATALLCGMRRSGKSNGIAVMAEELGRYYCPLCIGDSEDEYGPLTDHRYLPRGKWAGSAALLPQMEAAGMCDYVAVDLNGAYAFGQAIVRDVLQVVLHLKSYESDDEAAEIMTEIIYGMHDWEASRHNRERVPCTFILDEASKWLPQRLEESNLDKDVLSLLQQALFGTVVRRGGKQGLGLILATQRIAELDKRALQSQWKFLFRQTEAIDIGLYTRLGLERDEVSTLQQGECFLFSPTVIGFRTQLRPRYSPHLAHTPGLSELASHLRRVRPLELVSQHYASIEAASPVTGHDEQQGAGIAATPAPVRNKPKTELERVREAYRENPQTSYRELGEKLGMGKDKVGDLLKELRERGMLDEGQV